MRNSKEYVIDYLDFIQHLPIKRILLPDTLGVLIPSEVAAFISELVQRYPKIHFDFHAHNDYDLGTANALEAVRNGVHGLHLTVNGMGERAGNAPLASVIAVLNDYQKEKNMKFLSGGKKTKKRKLKTTKKTIKTQR
jgi:D-citramalate synthase